MPTTEPAEPPSAGEESLFTTELRKALDKAHSQKQEALYVFLDGARIKKLWVVLRELKMEHLALFRQSPKENLTHVTPFLARVEPRDNLLAWFTLHPGDLDSALFCTASASLQDLHMHLRRFLLVKDPSGKPMYFRFWDPLVIMPFLKTATGVEKRLFCGPMSSFLIWDAETWSGKCEMRFITWRLPPDTEQTPLPALPDAHRPFQIRPEQMEFFEAQGSASYDRRLDQHLRERYPKQLSKAKPEQVQGIVTQARELGPRIGLQSGREITHLAELMVLGLTDRMKLSIQSAAPQNRLGLMVEMRNLLAARETA